MVGTPIIGVVNVNRRLLYWKLYAASLVRGASSPYNTGNLLLDEYLPVGVDTNTESSINVTASAGNTESGSVSVSFVLDDTRKFVLSGEMIVYIPIELDLSQVDATYSGSATVDSVTVDLEILSLSQDVSTVVVSEEKSVGVSLSGVTATSQNWVEPVFLNVPETVFGDDNLLKVNITLKVSATADANATVDTVAVGKVIYKGDLVVILPVV